MSDEDFIQKWTNQDIERSSWDKNPGTVYWARSYKMNTGPLVEMSKDFLSTHYAANFTCSSKRKAKEILKAVADGSIWSNEFQHAYDVGE